MEQLKNIKRGTTKLKPCPFCGGEAELCTSYGNDGQVYYHTAFVKCTRCHAKTKTVITDGYYGTTSTTRDVTDDWNRRVEDDKT